MRKTTGLLFAFVLLNTWAFGQDDDDAIQKPTFGVHFFFNDFKTATAVRNNSLGIVFKNKQFAKVRDMSPGLALNYINGITRHFDFTTSLAGSFVDYPIPNKTAFNRDFLLLEGDVSVRGKMISNKAIINPYIQAGMGFSYYKSYLGAFLPLGAGLQVNIFNEAYILVNAQYRVPISEVTNYHFWWGIGLAGNIGKKKAE
jgi:OmpA-OmpF porin, OOP family